MLLWGEGLRRLQPSGPRLLLHAPAAPRPLSDLRLLLDALPQAGAAIAKRNLGMIDKTELEAQAIKEARRNFAEVLTELGLMPSFHERSAEEIDRIIEACVDGFQQAMQRQALNDDVPF